MDRRSDVSTGSSSLPDPTLLFAQRYQAFFQSTNDAIVIVSPDGEILDANPQLLKMCGHSYKNVVSKSFQELFDHNSYREIEGRIRILMAGRQRKHPLDCVLISKSGKCRSVEINLSLLKNQYGYSKTIFAIIRDVTQRREAQRRLVERADELQRVFDTVHTILLVLDEKRRVRRINRSGIEALGKEERDVLGEKVGDVLECQHRFDTKRGCGFSEHSRKCTLHMSIVRCLKTGETVLNAEESLSRDYAKDSPFYFQINTVPFETKGKRWCVVSLEDITARKKAEIEAMRLHNSITQANLELKKTLEDLAKSQSQLLESQKLEQIGLLASGLAHNLKTPLGGIKGYAQLMKLDYGEFHELDMIINEVEIMEQIINNLMLKSRKDHVSKEETLNLNDLLQIELEFLSANMFFKHRVKSKIVLDENLPTIRGVYTHFSQVIMNIIQNALDAMHDTPEKKLTVRTRHDNQFIYVDIHDTGCGIPEQIREKIFDVFYTTKPTSSEKKGNEPYGTGLGLSSANYFIHQYEGKIEIESREGVGTQATVRIPYKIRRQDRAQYRVLLVDDSESMVDILIQVCQSMGIEAYGAFNGESALEIYGKIKPHVVVSDLCMPGLTGPEMVARIRKNNPSQRVLYISGFSEKPEFRDWIVQESKYPSCSKVLRKPFPLDQFKKVMENMLFR